MCISLHNRSCIKSQTNKQQELKKKVGSTYREHKSLRDASYKQKQSIPNSFHHLYRTTKASFFFFTNRTHIHIQHKKPSPWTKPDRHSHFLLATLSPSLSVHITLQVLPSRHCPLFFFFAACISLSLFICEFLCQIDALYKVRKAILFSICVILQQYAEMKPTSNVALNETNSTLPP